MVEFLGERVEAYERRNPPQLKSCKLQLDPERIGTAQCNRFWLEQVLDIVVRNAGDELSDCGKPGPLIGFTSAEAEGRCDIIVTDNGRGFSAKVLSDFARERVVLKSETRSHRGLGLLMARVILNVYDGELSLGKSPHGGASVTLNLKSG